MSVMKGLQTRPKRKKNDMMFMFVCMNLVNTSAIHCMNTHAQQYLYTLVRCKRLWKSTNMNMKAFYIILWFINNRNGLLWIWKIVLNILKML